MVAVFAFKVAVSATDKTPFSAVVFVKTTLSANSKVEPESTVKLAAVPLRVIFEPSPKERVCLPASLSPNLREAVLPASTVIFALMASVEYALTVPLSVNNKLPPLEPSRLPFKIAKSAPEPLNSIVPCSYQSLIIHFLLII